MQRGNYRFFMSCLETGVRSPWKNEPYTDPSDERTFSDPFQNISAEKIRIVL